MAAPSALSAQIGVVDETTYGTPVTVTRFFEFNSESMSLDVQRIESNGLRTGTRTRRTDRWVANKMGASGAVEFEVHNKGFGFWPKHMLGGAATTTGASDPYTHTFVENDLTGDFFTMQVGRPDTGGTVRPFTYHGCKVTGWTVSNSVNGLLMLSLNIDAEDEDTSTGLASASYSASTELLAFTKGTVSLAASNVNVTDVSLTCDLGLKTDRRYLRGSPLKKEPLEAGRRNYSGTMTMEFESLAEYNRYVNGTEVELVATWTDSGGTHHWKMTCPKVRFDGDTPNISGPDILTLSLPFVVEYDGTNSPVTIEYVSADATA